MSSGTDKDRDSGRAAEQTGEDVSGTRPASAGGAPPPPTQPDPLLSALRPPEADGELGRLGGFSVLRVLGQGGMGAVFVAHDPLVRREVALKVMRPELTARPESYQRFLREARTAAAVEHDHIIPVYQVGADNGVLFIAMPLLRGEALDQRLTREPRLSIPAVLKLGRETAEGLAAAHERGLIHRDIKPGNLWLEGTDESAAGFRRVKILDFGLARAVHEDTHLTAAGGILGTPAYMAPEQAEGRDVGPRADLFSLGALLYRCCAGKAPFAGPSTMAILSALANRTPAPLREANPDLPPPLADLITRMLAKAPEDRPQSAQEVAEALRRIEQDYTIPSAAKVPRRSRFRRVAAVLAAVLAVAAAVGVVVVKVKRPGGRESEVTAPEGSKVAVDDRGNVTVTLPPDEPAPKPPADQADPEELECRLKAGNSGVLALVITPDGKNVIAGYAEGCLRVWDLGERKIVREYTTGSPVLALALHPDGKTLAVNCADGALFTWDRTTGEVVRRFTGYLVCGWGLSFARGGQILVTPADHSRAVLCWETATGKHRVLTHWPREAGSGFVQVAPDGEQVALTATARGPMRLFNLSSGELIWASWDLKVSNAAPAFSSDGEKMASSDGWEIKIWDRKSGAPEIKFAQAGTIYGLAISPQNRFLAAANGGARQVQLFDRVGPPYPIRVWGGPAPHRVAFTPDGRRLLSAHEEGTIRVFQMPENVPPWRGFPPLDPTWLARTTGLPADEQVKEVTAELARRNPGFRDPLQVLKDKEGRGWSAAVQTTQLEDLSPFRGFPALRELKVEAIGMGIGKVWDLSCLRGTRLTTLFLRGNRVGDLSPLRDIPVTFLVVNENPLYDLTPLQGMKLWNIALCGTGVTDISPLRGMPLGAVELHQTCIRDLSPLSKSPVKFITVSAPDLEPLRGLPLEAIELRGDYRPEQIKMVLRIPTLKVLGLFGKYDPEQLKEFRGNPILKTINYKPAAEFWKADDKTVPDKKGRLPDDD